MTRSEAFLEQARSDFEVYRMLRETPGLPECHQLHYLQMAAEKLAKAVRLRMKISGADAVSHVAFSRLAGPLRLHRPAAEAMGMSRKAFREFIRRAAGSMAKIEQLHLQLGNIVNVEYPWQARDESGALTWRVPARYRFLIVDELRNRSDGQTLLKLIAHLLRDFDVIFQTSAE